MDEVKCRGTKISDESSEVADDIVGAQRRRIDHNYLLLMAMSARADG